MHLDSTHPLPSTLQPYPTHLPPYSRHTPASMTPLSDTPSLSSHSPLLPPTMPSSHPIPTNLTSTPTSLPCPVLTSLCPTSPPFPPHVVSSTDPSPSSMRHPTLPSPATISQTSSPPLPLQSLPVYSRERREPVDPRRQRRQLVARQGKTPEGQTRQPVSARPRIVRTSSWSCPAPPSISTDPPLTSLRQPKSPHLLLPPSSSILLPILPSSPSPPFHRLLHHPPTQSIDTTPAMRPA